MRFRVGAVVMSMLAAFALPLVGAPPAGAAVGDGTVLGFGYVTFHGSTAGLHLNAPVIDMIGTASGAGYWLLAADGGVFSYGDARFHGSTGAMRLNRPIIGGAAVPKGGGYWLFASDGGVFSFGAAKFYGSTGAMRLNQPIVDMIVTPSGRGYWLVASDGGVFSFGDAQFFGSTGAIRLAQPIVAAAAGPKGRGYWLVASDGGVFSFGSARFYGSAAGSTKDPVVDVARTSDARGYWLVTDTGQVFEFGSAQHFGDGIGIVPYERRVVAIQSPWQYGYFLATAPRANTLPQLGPGDSGADVLALQNRLASVGYWLGTPDSGYGLLTEQAVTAFQKVNGLERTGRVDRATQLALQHPTRPGPRVASGDHIEVDKARQVVIVVRGGRTSWVFNTSTGTERPYVFEGRTYLAHTPDGTFKIVRAISGYHTGRLGTLYNPRYFTNDGVAFHGYPSVPSYPASHGCVRLTNAAIDWVWANNIMPIGHTVVVY
jgi:hypothetical protein